MVARYKPQRMAGGVVLPSSLDMRPRHTPLPLEPRKGPFRAVVLQTYVSTDSDSFRKKTIECDVVLTKTHVPLNNVAVMQRSHGLNDADLWIPRPTTKTVSLAPLQADTLYDDYDGDLVLVDFIEGDSEYPIITGALSHEQTKRKIVTGSGWSEGDPTSRGTAHTRERYIHHRGTEFRINEGGDLLIDTVGAYGSDDNESPLPGVGGQIRLRLKDLLRFTVECNGVDVFEIYKDETGVHCDVGEGALEPMVLGNILKTILSALTVPTSFGASGTPINAATFDQFLAIIGRVK